MENGDEFVVQNEANKITEDEIEESSLEDGNLMIKLNPMQIRTFIVNIEDK